MVSYKQWRILNENMGGPMALGIKTPQTVGVMGSQVPPDMDDEENPDMDAEMGDEENPEGEEGMEDMGDEMGDEENPEGEEGMGDEMGGDDMGMPQPPVKDDMAGNTDKHFMGMDYMDTDMEDMPMDKGPVMHPAGDEFEKDEIPSEMGGEPEMGDEGLSDDDLANDMGDEDDAEADPMAGEEGGDMAPEMGDSDPMMQNKAKVKPMPMKAMENSFLARFSSNAKGTVRRSIKEDTLVAPKVAVKKEPAPGEVDYAPVGKVGSIGSQNFAEWRKAKETK